MTKWIANRRQQPENVPGAATHSALRPGDYALGSLQSRAAARAMIKEMETEKLIIKIHFVSKLGTPMAKTPYRVDHGPNATIEYYREDDDCEQQETNTESS